MDDPARELERRLELPLLIAALLVVPIIIIEESETSGGLDLLASVMNWCSWLVFAGAAFAQLRVTDDKVRWCREHPLEVAIVVLTPPFLPASMQAARFFQVLRLLRLVHAAKVLRRMFSTEGVRDAAVLALLTILVGGAGYASVEEKQDMSTWDGVWFAMTTVTTVGYGDFSPETEGGRIIAMAIMLMGIGFVAILTGAAAQRFLISHQESVGERREIAEKLDEISQRLDAIERRG